MERVWIAAAGLSGTVAVAADAAAQHLLVADPYRLGLAAIAARYGLVHAAVLVALVCLRRVAAGRAAGFWLSASCWCIVAGLVLFCGPLYLRAAGVAPAIGVLVPVGGTVLIAGWTALFLSALCLRRT